MKGTITLITTVLLTCPGKFSFPHLTNMCEPTANPLHKNNFPSAVQLELDIM